MVKPSDLNVSPLAGMSALVVDPDDAGRALAVATLAGAGLETTATGDFATARAHLISHPPAVLVAEIRLERHNGLYLALLGRTARPGMAVIVTSAHFDPFVQRQATAIGAEFMLTPLNTSQLLAAVYRSVLVEPNADGTIGPSLREWQSEHFAAVSSGSGRRGRGVRTRQRNMATFLWLESLKRGT